MTQDVVTIPSRITKGEELVVVPRSWYEKFSRWEKERKRVEEETEEVLKKVERGKKAYRQEREIDKIIALGESELKQGKTIVAKSSKEALKIFYDRKKNK